MEPLNHSNTDEEAKKDEVEKDKPQKKRGKKILLGLGIALIVVVLSSCLGVYFLLRPFPGRTNILALGVAGEGHIAGDLTDTIIFLSLDHKTGKVLVLSLPRDIWIPDLKTKLNSVYHYQGMEGIKEVVAEILAQPIDHSVLINFDVFRQIIDTLGGVEVDVERSFDDYRYPIPGRENDFCGGDPEYRCRYEHLHFDAGSQHMDGERVLKYIRSRFAEGEEGTDFARSQRQQKLLVAVKNKILSREIFLSYRKVRELIGVVISSVETDIPREKYLTLVRVILRFRSENLWMEVLDDNRLVSPPPSRQYDYQWVLIPQTENWQEIQEYVNRLLSGRF